MSELSTIIRNWNRVKFNVRNNETRFSSLSPQLYDFSDKVVGCFRALIGGKHLKGFFFDKSFHIA
jgi:hypothetical protein